VKKIIIQGKEAIFQRIELGKTELHRCHKTRKYVINYIIKRRLAIFHFSMHSLTMALNKICMLSDNIKPDIYTLN
jgi:hypothetical protein